MTGRIRLITKKEDVKAFRRACRLTSKLMQLVLNRVHPGVTTVELEEFVVKHMERNGAKSASKGYRGFPGSICTSVNEVVCHGIPGERELRSGDILKVDIALSLDGWYGDHCETVVVGHASEGVRRLVEVADGARRAGIGACRPGNTTKHIAEAISSHVRYHDYGLVYEMGGHGIGRELHAMPFIPSQWIPSKHGVPVKLVPGMALTIEPIVNYGSRDILEDGMSYVTADNLPSAQFEHTVLITEDGCDVMTARPK